jgi:hypothetical protein
LTHCVGSASATTPKVAIIRSVCKPEESEVNYSSHSVPLTDPMITQCFLAPRLIRTEVS